MPLYPQLSCLLTILTAKVLRKIYTLFVILAGFFKIPPQGSVGVCGIFLNVLTNTPTGGCNYVYPRFSGCCFLRFSPQHADSIRKAGPWPRTIIRRVTPRKRVTILAILSRSGDFCPVQPWRSTVSWRRRFQCLIFRVRKRSRSLDSAHHRSTG